MAVWLCGDAIAGVAGAGEATGGMSKMGGASYGDSGVGSPLGALTGEEECNGDGVIGWVGDR